MGRILSIFWLGDKIFYLERVNTSGAIIVLNIAGDWSISKWLVRILSLLKFVTISSEPPVFHVTGRGYLILLLRSEVSSFNPSFDSIKLEPPLNNIFILTVSVVHWSFLEGLSWSHLGDLVWHVLSLSWVVYLVFGAEVSTGFNLIIFLPSVVMSLLLFAGFPKHLQFNMRVDEFCAVGIVFSRDLFTGRLIRILCCHLINNMISRKNILFYFILFQVPGVLGFWGLDFSAINFEQYHQFWSVCDGLLSPTKFTNLEDLFHVERS